MTTNASAPVVGVAPRNAPDQSGRASVLVAFLEHPPEGASDQQPVRYAVK